MIRFRLATLVFRLTISLCSEIPKMPIRVTCTACGRVFRVDDRYTGKTGRCPNRECRTQYRVPDAPISEYGNGATTSSSAKTSLKWGSASRSPLAVRPPHRAPWVVGIAAVALLASLSGFAVWRSGGSAGPGSTENTAIAKDTPAVVPTFATHGLPLAKKYCFDCHSGKEPDGGIAFDSAVDDRAVLKSRKLWERALDLVEQGVMPPEDGTPLSADDKAQLIAVLDKTLNFVDCSQGVDPGRVTIRRLNRNEYNNTVRDLLGVNFRPADDFPSDDVGYGFDNIGDVLSLPPLLMEKYLDAADSIARQSIIAIDPNSPKEQTVGARALTLSRAATRNRDVISINSEGQVSAKFEAALAGKYRLVVRAAQQRGGDEPAKMELRVDGEMVADFNVRNGQNRLENYEKELALSRGVHEIAAAFVNDFYDEKNKQDRNLFVQQLQLEGPLEIDPAAFPESHRQLVEQRPSAEQTVNVAVRSNLRPFVKRAFRRPVAESELDGYVRLVESRLTDGDTFEMAMQQALTAVLVSPHFLFRIETDRNPDDPTDRHVLSDYELATRLSYFLWSSMPDEELFTLAEKNELHRDDVLETQVKRMLRDGKAQALVDNFAEQWLQLRVLDEITPDPEKYPQFTAELRNDMKEETKRLFAYVMHEDLSLLELLDAPYTFVNERLAKHYGLPEVDGTEFQKVSLEGTSRVGLLTQGSVMTMTSNPDRTSPVKRGKWVMEVVLNTPPPPPPPNVPELDAVKAPEGATLRQQLRLHRENASCASCHRIMDDLGFGLENFDAIGRYRDTDGAQPLDTSGELPGGMKFNGPKELAVVLKQKELDFGRSVIEKMLTYALGRPVEYYDRCTQNTILDHAKANDFRFSALVTAITRSEPFRMRRGEEPHAE